MLKPENEAKITGGVPYSCFRKLRIRIVDQSESLRQMHVRGSSDTLLCEFTSVSVGQFREGIEDVRRGIGDYSICPEPRLPMGIKDRESEYLTFWPCFGHLKVVE